MWKLSTFSCYDTKVNEFEASTPGWQEADQFTGRLIFFNLSGCVFMMVNKCKEEKEQPPFNHVDGA